MSKFTQNIPDTDGINFGMQAEVGVFCPVSMTDALARALECYASKPLQIVILLLEQADLEILRGPTGTGKRKWLIALLYLHCHILVHPDGWAADNDPTALNYFDALVDWQPIPVG